MQKPLISVILPTHNRASLLVRSVNSVLTQTYSKLELIVVDDCSSDDTPQVIASIDDARLRYIRLQSSHKAAAARNVGIEAAKGDFLAFQDDDDLWLDFKLEQQLAHLLTQDHRVGLSISSYIRDFGDYQDEVRGPERFQAMDFRRGPLSGFALIATPGWLVRSECMQKVGGFDSKMQSWDDWELAYRLRKVCDFVHFDKPTYVQNRATGGDMWNKRHVFAFDLRHIISKHGHDWSGDAQTRAHYLQLLGRYEAEFGETRNARKALLSAIRLNPRHLKTWSLLALSFLGNAGFAALCNTWRSLRKT